MTEDMNMVRQRQEQLDRINRARLAHAYVENCASQCSSKKHRLLSTSAFSLSVGSLTPKYEGES